MSSVRNRSQPSHRGALNEFKNVSSGSLLRPKRHSRSDLTRVRMFDIEENELLTFSITERTHQAMAHILEATASERINRTIDAGRRRKRFDLHVR